MSADLNPAADAVLDREAFEILAWGKVLILLGTIEHSQIEPEVLTVIGGALSGLGRELQRRGDHELEGSRIDA